MPMNRDHNLSIDTEAAARGQRVTVNPTPEDLDESDDDLSPSPMIDEDIDFSLVYALHNFKATVEGQTTVGKGDPLNLLDDSNSYWWLVKVVKNEEVGYIPAENIETPYERLARLNKRRNINLSSSLNNVEEDESSEQKKYPSGKKIAETTTQEKVEINESVEVNKVNVNQEITISASISTQVGENIDPNITKEPTNLIISTGQNNQDKNNGTYHQRDSSMEQQQGLSASNMSTPTSAEPSEVSKNKTKKGFFNKLFKLKKKSTQPKQSSNNSRNRSNSQPNPSRQYSIGQEYNVLRVFAGQNLSSNFNSKVVLLNKSVTASSLIKQAIHRFKLEDENPDNYYISIKEVNKDEKYLMPDQYPLEMFSSLISSYSTTIPSIKRSSVSSNLSNISDDESIKKLQLNDGLNTVCLCLNRKAKLGEKKLRVRVLIYSDDLPAHLRPVKVVETRVSMSVPKHLAEKAARRRSKEEAKPREKSLIMHANATARQVIEKTMEKIGITEGIVDDGERVHYEDERPRYQLMIIVDGEDVNIISVYTSTPDLRHFSIDSIDSESSLAIDYRPDESIFVLRLLRQEERQQRAMPSAEEVKRYTQDVRTAELKINQEFDDKDDELSRKLLIERQRQYSQAKQRSILSTRKNQEKGVDIVTDMGSIRSSRVFGDKVRYSFVSTGGDTIDISKLIEDIWGDDELLNINDSVDNLSSIEEQDEDSADLLSVNAKKQRRKSTTQEVDILEKLMINQSSEELVENKIEQVLKKVKAGQYDDMTSGLLPITIDNDSLHDMSDKQSIIGSTASILENDWILSDDFGLQELLVLVRSGVDMLEIKQRRRSGWHLHDDPEKILERINPEEIRDEIKSVFESVNEELDMLEMELDRMMIDAIRVF
ncbi:24446_t:CDS:2 [Gigaspora rosea]|nr:24446_t:CDS:2 [Gigaspora rosea]